MTGFQRKSALRHLSPSRATLLCSASQSFEPLNNRQDPCRVALFWSLQMAAWTMSM